MCSSALFFKYILLYKVTTMQMEIYCLWNIYFWCFCKTLWHMCFYRKGGLLSQNSLDFQGGETFLSHKKDHQENMLGVRHQTAAILNTAHYVLDVKKKNIYVCVCIARIYRFWTGNLFVLQRFFYPWEDLLNRKTF